MTSVTIVLCRRIALGRAVGVLDDVDADRFDEAVGADLQDLVDARIGGQHQRDDGRAEQHAAVDRLRLEANPVRRSSAGHVCDRT